MSEIRTVAPITPISLGKLRIKGSAIKKRTIRRQVKRPGKPQVIRSWLGLEHQREELRAAARDYYVADQQLAEACEREGRGDPIGYTIAERKRPGMHKLVEAQRAGATLNHMIELHTALVQQHGLCFYFVRNEWAPILNPSPSEKYRCAKLMEKLETESAEEELNGLDISSSS